MALREKLGSLGSIAAAATEKATSKANQAIESGKLTLKITAEEKKIEEFVLNIGDLVLDQLDAGQVYDDEVMALYGAIQASREIIEETKATLAARRPAPESGPVCAACGSPVAEGDRFCAQCGEKLPEPVVEITPEESPEADPAPAAEETAEAAPEEAPAAEAAPEETPEA
jgi:hypothetical protein